MLVVIYGVPQSSYVRTARWTCEEKGVAHETGRSRFAPRSTPRCILT
jgi:hypothetical protein